MAFKAIMGKNQRPHLAEGWERRDLLATGRKDEPQVL